MVPFVASAYFVSTKCFAAVHVASRRIVWSLNGVLLHQVICTGQAGDDEVCIVIHTHPSKCVVQPRK